MQDLIITTERCTIRKFQEGDIDVFMSYRNNSDWMKYQGFKGLSKEAYRQALLKDAPIQEGIQLAVANRISDILIGDLYIKREAKDFWIGYTIHPACSGQGLMTEAVKGLITWLKEHTDCANIFAGVLPGNLRSKNLLLKLGFVYSHNDFVSGDDIYTLNL